jgi:hypothetical protein
MKQSKNRGGKRQWACAVVASGLAALGVPLAQAATQTYLGGTAVPPDTLGSVLLKRLTNDPRPEGSLVLDVPAPVSLTLDRCVEVRNVGSGWGGWSHGFDGTVYYTSGRELILTPPPGTLALGLSLEPNLAGVFKFELSTDSAWVSVNVDGDGGAQYVGFWSDDATEPIRYLRILDTTGGADGFAVAEAGVYFVPVPEPAATAATLLLTALGWTLVRRRR